MELHSKLKRLKTWWRLNTKKPDSEIFYPDIYKLYDHAYNIFEERSKYCQLEAYIYDHDGEYVREKTPTYPPLDFLKRMERIFPQEGCEIFLEILKEAYNNFQILSLNKKNNVSILEGHEKEKAIPFGGNWRSWGEALIVRSVEGIDNKELFKNAKKNGFYVEEDWGYISTRESPVYHVYSRKQLNDLYASGEKTFSIKQ